ncbi:MAG: hypothetical protein JO126_08365 [Alphaproteobacteria bacterium]|nr:hypothetical protein [Alphaproteobacteria bacterium]MBV8549454.1 hypothetical protein [Alphaproteobacteria bacterium]
MAMAAENANDYVSEEQKPDYNVLVVGDSVSRNLGDGLRRNGIANNNMGSVGASIGHVDNQYNIRGLMEQLHDPKHRPKPGDTLIVMVGYNDGSNANHAAQVEKMMSELEQLQKEGVHIAIVTPPLGGARGKYLENAKLSTPIQIDAAHRHHLNIYSLNDNFLRGDAVHMADPAGFAKAVMHAIGLQSDGSLDPSKAGQTTQTAPQQEPEAAKRIQQVLAERRKQKFAEELKDPELRKEIYAAGSMETEDKVAFLESILNRADMQGKTLRQALHDGFYGPINHGRLPGAMAGLTSSQIADYDMALDTVIAGSNTINLATDQGEKTEIRGPEWNVGGEWYGHMNGNRSWADMICATANTTYVPSPQYSGTPNPGDAGAVAQRFADEAATDGVLHFDTSSAAIDPRQMQSLRSYYGKLFEKHKGETLEIKEIDGGHDSTGSNAANERVSAARADAIEQVVEEVAKEKGVKLRVDLKRMVDPEQKVGASPEQRFAKVVFSTGL